MLRLVRKRIKHSHPVIKAASTFIIITVLAFIVPIAKSSFDIGNVLSATSIFYSILLGFYIASSMANLSRLKTLVATETGALIAVYRLVFLSLPQKANQVKEAIDRYLIKRFDYEIDEYVEPTTKEYFEIFDILKDAKTKSEGEGAALNYVAEAMYYVAQARREISIVSAKIVSSESWLVLNVLSLIIVLSLFLMRDGSIGSSLVAALLSSSAISALFILDDVDGNRFGEEQFAINTYQDVFTAIGKPHYYPTIYTEAGRYKPILGQYRTGDSKNVYTVKNNRFSKPKKIETSGTS